MGQVNNRRERRTSNRKPMFTAILLVVVAIFSFGIGYMAGRNSAPTVSATVASVPSKPITMPKPDPSIEVVEEKVEGDNLTFFEALPKGEQQPLGTGINLPPEEKDPVAAKIAQQAVEVSPAPAKAAPIKPVATVVKPSVKPAKTVVASAKAPHVLQVASFKSPDEAGILMRSLEKKGYLPYIQQADLGSKGIWYRVFLGPYANKDKAKTAALSLKVKEKLDSLIRRK